MISQIKRYLPLFDNRLQYLLLGGVIVLENKKQMRKDARRDGKFYGSAVNTYIRKRLDDLGWTAVDLRNSLQEKGLSLSCEAVRQWISGYSQPKLENIPIVAAALRCSISYLFGVDELPDMEDTQIFESTGLTQPALNWLRKSNKVDSVMLNILFATGAIDDVLSGIAFYALKGRREIKVTDMVGDTPYTGAMSDKVTDDISMFVAQQNFANAARTCLEAFEGAERVTGIDRECSAVEK